MAVQVRSEIAGSVWKIEIEDGATVAAEDVIIIMESMKMEIPVEAPVGGICRLFVKVGEAIREGDVVAEIG